ncbi:hypothetical protein QOT17_024595 [Balamuthia mandrillaris]
MKKRRRDPEGASGLADPSLATFYVLCDEVLVMIFMELVSDPKSALSLGLCDKRLFAMLEGLDGFWRQLYCTRFPVFSEVDRWRMQSAEDLQVVPVLFDLSHHKMPSAPRGFTWKELLQRRVGLNKDQTSSFVSPPEEQIISLAALYAVEQSKDMLDRIRLVAEYAGYKSTLFSYLNKVLTSILKDNPKDQKAIQCCRELCNFRDNLIYRQVSNEDDTHKNTSHYTSWFTLFKKPASMAKEEPFSERDALTFVVAVTTCDFISYTSLLIGCYPHKISENWFQPELLRYSSLPASHRGHRFYKFVYHEWQEMQSENLQVNYDAMNACLKEFMGDGASLSAFLYGAVVAGVVPHGSWNVTSALGHLFDRLVADHILKEEAGDEDPLLYAWRRIASG